MNAMNLRTLLIVLYTTIFAGDLVASQLTVSTDIGFDPIDNTSFLQFAFDESVEDTIIVDNVGMDWNAGPLRVERNNVTIIFEEGVVLRALPGVFDIFDSFITLTDKNNINLIGYGSTIIMNKQEYIDLADSEFRHGISLNSSIDIKIEGFTILDTGGDGILLTRSFQPNSPQNYCENILIKNCICSNNYRQGLSITSVKNASIINCEFSETNGTLPEDGIDIEPDTPEERIENVLIKGCRIFNNHGNAVQLALFMMEDSSLDVSVTIEDTYMSNNHDPSNVFAFAEIAATDNNSNGVDGFVEFKNCFIESSEWTAVYASKTIDSYDLNFKDCVFKNISNNPISFNNPIFVEVTDYDNPVQRFGGLSFVDCTIIYDEDIPFFNIFENLPTSDGLGNVIGNFHIVNPNDAGFNIGTNPENVTITYDYYDTFPTSEANLSSSQIDYLEQDQHIIYDVNRQGNLNTTLAVPVSYTGSTSYGVDYNREPGFVIIPRGMSSVTDTITIVADDIFESSEILELNILENECVTPGSASEINFSINDLVTTNNPTYELAEFAINVFPDPDLGLVFIRTLVDDYDVTILDNSGQMVKEYSSLSFSILLDISEFGNGMHSLELRNNSNSDLHVIRLLEP